MLRLTLELVPFGDETHKKHLGTVEMYRHTPTRPTA